MITIAMTLALALSPQEPITLTFVHGDEQIVTWLDRASMRRTGDRVRSRVLRIRHVDQAFWIAQEIDCAANTRAQLDVVNAEGPGSAPSLEGEAWHRPIPHYDRFTRAVRNAVCDGTFVNAGVRPVRGEAAAIAMLERSQEAAVRVRPLELIVVRGGVSPILIDRATLEGGGPQWEIRSLKMTGGRGVWSFWEFDCSGATHMAADLRWTVPMTANGGYGPWTRDHAPVGPVAAGSDAAIIKDVACAEDIWERPVHSSRDASLRAARANPR